MTPRHARRAQPRSADRFGPLYTARVLFGSALASARTQPRHTTWSHR